MPCCRCPSLSLPYGLGSTYNTPSVGLMPVLELEDTGKGASCEANTLSLFSTAYLALPLGLCTRSDYLGCHLHPCVSSLVPLGSR